tara:strand:- start:3949 stop:4983 length:1035 start_codon:yes stop_codon:yes gene_type:complete
MSKHNYDKFSPRHTQPLVVDWAVGSQCNFSCTYCTPSIYDGRSPWHNIADCKRFLDFIHTNICKPNDQYMLFNIHAGEPTLWPHLDEFCAYAKQLDSRNHIRLLTNGTRNTKWWCERTHLIDSVIVSIHHGQSKNEKIADKFSEVYANGMDVSLHVMVDTHAFETCIESYQYLLENLQGPQIKWKPLRENITKEYLQAYTQDQLDIMHNLQHRDGTKKWHGNAQSRMQWSLLNNTPVIVTNIEKELLITKNNDWEDWYCNIGIESIVVQHLGRIKPGSNCFTWLDYGKITDKEYSIPVLPIKCKYKYCGCLTDLQTTKVRDLQPGEQYIDASLSENAYKIATRD